MQKQTEIMNFGKLKGVSPEQNIVYYRRGQDELSLNITNACPNACTFCIRDRDKGWGVSNLYLVRDPTINEIITAFDTEHVKMLRDRVKLNKVKICGYGEPILRCNDLPPILEHIRDNSDAQIQLTTTGWPYFRYVSPSIGPLQDLKEAGLTHVYLSISATDASEYVKLVKPSIGASAFEEAIRFGWAAQKLGLDVTMGFVNLPNTNEERIKEFSRNTGLKYKLREMEK